MGIEDTTFRRLAGRRQLLRGAAIGGAGLAAAALLGCSNKSSGSATSTGSSSSGSSGSGAPKNIKRSQGVPSPDVPVNNRKFVKGGTFTVPVTSTYNVAQNDTQLTVGGNRTEAVTDRLVYPNGFNGAISFDM